MKKVTKEDWKLKDLHKFVRVNWYREFTVNEIATMKLGHIPNEMEDRWFFYEKDDIVYFHRSWTGFCIFQLHLNTITNNHILKINTNPVEYKYEFITIQESIASLDKLIKSYTQYNEPICNENKVFEKITNEHLSNKSKFSIYLAKGDITKADVDCIVNAANPTLLGGGGVDGAIHRAAGPELLLECSQFRGCKTGDVVITKGYNLIADYIIHAVGPIYHDYPHIIAERFLSSCYKKSLDLAYNTELHSIAFPCISTGVYKYPNELAAQVALDTIIKWKLAHPNYNLRVYLFCFLDKDYEIYKRLLPIKEERYNKLCL